MALKPLRCPNCNATIKTFDETIKKGFCPFCDSVIVDVQERQNSFATGERGELVTKEADFIIKGGVLEKYNGEAVDVVIPDGVRVIGDDAFYGMAGIESVVIPSSVVAIGSDGFLKGTFRNCTRLKKVVVPASVASIGKNAFENCESLESVSLSGVAKIDDFAFMGCKKLSSVEFSRKPLELGYSVFNDCPKLEQVEFFDTVSFQPFNKPFDCTAQVYDYEEGCTIDANLLSLCGYGERNELPGASKPSLLRIIFPNREAAQKTSGPLADYLLDTAVQSFDAAIHKEEAEMASVGLFGKKKKEEHQRRINNLKAVKELLPDYCLQIEIRG